MKSQKQSHNCQTARGNSERSYTGSILLSHSRMRCKVLVLKTAWKSKDIKNWYETMKQNRESGVDPSSGSQQRHQEKAWEKAVLTAGLSGAAVHPCAE